MGAFIAKMLLPTVSSLVFLPTASVAAKRGFHMEAMVYFFTMFFTAIYHACDGPGLSILCFMRYDVMEYFSVYGTALSMWVTLMALGDFDEPQRSSLNMFGVLTIAVRIYQDRWGYGIYSGPIGSAIFIITVKWLQKMKQLRAVYPEKTVYTQQVGPGCCFGALALMLRFYFEEWDYAYVHSFYHLSLAVSFVLLLPKKNRFAGTGQNAAKLSCFTLCFCSMSPATSKDNTQKLQEKKKKKKEKEEKEKEKKKEEEEKKKKEEEKEKEKEKKEEKEKEKGKEKKKEEEEEKKKKKSSWSVWTIPTEKLWTRGCSTPILPLYNPSPSTPIKGTNISKLKEMNGWK